MESFTREQHPHTSTDVFWYLLLLIRHPVLSDQNPERTFSLRMRYSGHTRRRFLKQILFAETLLIACNIQR